MNKSFKETLSESKDYMLRGFPEGTSTFTKVTKIGVPVVFGFFMTKFLGPEVFITTIFLLMVISFGLGFLFLYLSKRSQ